MEEQSRAWGSGEESGTRFPTTRWEDVRIAGVGHSSESLAALEALCQAYWQPLYAYARRSGHSVHQAQDLTQAFFEHFLGKGSVRAADRTRGRFRSFLLTSFRHFLTHEWDKARSAKRGGAVPVLSWEQHQPDLEQRLPGAFEATAEAWFDREWALRVLERALHRLREDYRSPDREPLWDALGRFLHADPDPGEYDRVAGRLGIPPRSVKVTVHRLRRRYGRLVRDEVLGTLADPADLDDEVGYLVRLIGA